jgi:predicted glycoside hydrolase/deacetylase ChbG (UPF0249 family)
VTRLRLLISADDFGASPEVNRGIQASFERGWIDTASLMANMPAFDEACAMVREHGWAGRTGLHFNLGEGHPLTLAIARCPRFCDARGRLRPRSASAFGGAFWLSSVEKRALEAECEAQIDACVAGGAPPHYLDSHFHQHAEWPIGAALIRVARRRGIRALRISRNSRVEGWARRIYKAAFNARLAAHGLARTRWFGSIDDVLATLPALAGDVEVMVHPRWRDGRVVDLDGRELEPLVKALRARAGNS